MTEFVALYRGRTVSDAELVALSAEPRLVQRFFAELMGAEASKEVEERKVRMFRLVGTQNEGNEQR